MIFGNRQTGTTPVYSQIYLTDYGYTAPWTNFGNLYQTPNNYPVTDQIGVGMDPKKGASAPVYLWNNLAAGSRGAGTATVDWTLSWKSIPQAAIDLYRTQTGNPSASYTLQNMIQADRDYFKHTHGAAFDGSTGVGIGPKAQMTTIRGTKAGVGFWVTDEGEWNSKNPGPDGQLYVWSGSDWGLKYRPFTYPHPMRVMAVPAPPTGLSVR